MREEPEILSRGELRVEVQLVREQTDARPQRGAQPARQLVAVADLAFRRRGQRREHRDERGFAGPVRTEQSDDVAGARGKGNVRQRAAAPEVARDVDDLNGIEVDAHVLRHAQDAPSTSRGAARSTRSAGSGPVSWLSSAL